MWRGNSHLEKLLIRLFKYLTFSVPRLVLYMNLRFDNAMIKFEDKKAEVVMYFREADTYPFVVTVR